MLVQYENREVRLTKFLCIASILFLMLSIIEKGLPKKSSSC